MTLDQLKQQYYTHGSTQFRAHYGVSQYKIYAVFWYLPTGIKWWKKEKIPDDWMTPMERKKLFYELTWQPEMARTKKKSEVYEDTIRKVQRYKEQITNEPIEPYVWRFSFAFNRF